MTDFLPVGGGTMAGPLYLVGDATGPLEAATYRQLVNGINPEDDIGDPIEDGEAPTVTLSIRGAIRSAVVVWTALSGVHGNGYYEVEVDTSISFDSGNLQSGQTKGLIMGFDDLEPGAVYYCRLRARNAEGVLSGWSATTNTTLGLAGGVDIEAGSITAADAVFDTAAITDADIADLNVGKLQGGQLQVTEFIESDNYAPLASGFRIDGDGNAEFHSATISGNIIGATISGATITGGTFRTDSSGDRIEISDSFVNSIQFFVGDGASSIQGTANGLRFSPQDDTGAVGYVQVNSNLNVLNDLNVSGSKNFAVPHPTDPAKDVVHASYEGPGPGGTIYRYRVDVVDGEATVELPEYFDGINRDVDVHVSPASHFGRAYGQVNGTTLTVFADADGEYAVLVLGTRDDAHAQAWQPGDDVRERDT